MSKKLLLLAVPALMLSACNLFGNNGNATPEGLYKPTASFAEDRKGDTISNEEAYQRLDEISNRMGQTINNLQANLPDFFTYSFRTDVDDKYNLTGVEYAKSANYLHTNSENHTPNDNDVVKESLDIYNYPLNEDFIQAKRILKDGVETKEYTKLEVEETIDWTKQVQDMGREVQKYINNYRTYLEREYKSGNVELQFRSKGEGHLYAYLKAPSLGATVEVLFEDYFLTYGYAYLGLKGISDFIPAEFKEYTTLMTEIHAEFNEFEPSYPNLAEYTEK